MELEYWERKKKKNKTVSLSCSAVETSRLRRGSTAESKGLTQPKPKQAAARVVKEGKSVQCSAAALCTVVHIATAK